MFFGHNPQETRQLFFSSWQKYELNQPLTPLEQQLVNVILDHPEYLGVFQAIPPAASLSPTDNPFLHMGLHLAIRDQITLNKPAGLTRIYQALQQQHQNVHQVEHLLMEPFAACLWEANRTSHPPDDVRYLNACQELIST